MTMMTIVLWIAGGFALVAVLGSSAFLGVRAFRTWRMFRAFSKAAGDALEEVMTSVGTAEAHAASAAKGAERLAAATARLQESRAELSLLQAAAGEFTATLARVRGVVPTK
jgi:hypothetical protein